MKYIFSFIVLTIGLNTIAQTALTPEKLWEFKRVSGGTVSSDGKFLLFTQTTYDIAENKGNSDIFVVQLETSKVVQLTNTPFSEVEPQWSASNKIWFLSAESGTMEVWKMNPDASGKEKMSNFGDIALEGFKIAPDESSIITLQSVKMKQTVNDVYSDLPKANVRIEDDLMYRHWDHWDDFNKLHLFLHKIEGNQISAKGKDLNANENFDAVMPPFGGMESVAYFPDSKAIVYAAKKMNGKEFAQSTNSSLYWTSLVSDYSEELTSPKEYKGYDTHPSFSINKDMAWLSMRRDGFESDKNDLIVRHYKTNSDINLTKDLAVSVTDYAWHPDGTRLYFLAATQGTIQVYEVYVLSRQIRQLTKGQHDYTSVAASGSYVFSARQSMIAPADLYAIQTHKVGKSKEMNSVIQLTNANKEIMDGLLKPTVKETWVETTDGKKMLSWMILPPNFDSTKTYPTLLYCQGGPQSPVSQFFSYRWNFMLMASQGYIVVAPNRRGLPGFGQEWNDAISKDWGGQAMRDYLSAIDAATKNSFVDKNRLGAIGASYGGYSVYYLAGIHEKRFKTFVSHCGLFNLESWYGTTEELFFANWDIGGPYWDAKNKELYEKNSPHKLVQNWDTPIMVIHGGMDFRVPESEGMQAFQAAQLKGLKSKYLYFPTEGHWVLKPQNGLVWHREFFKWLDEDLKTK